MLVIDFHTHILPKVIPNFTQQFNNGIKYISLESIQGSDDKWMMKGEERFRKVALNCFDIDKRITEMNTAGINVQVLSTVPVMFSYSSPVNDASIIARFLNDDIANSVSCYPQRFIGLGTVPMQDSFAAVQEMQRCKYDLKLAGLQIGSHVNEMNFDDPKLMPFWAECEKENYPLFVHPWDMCSDERFSKHWFPWLIMMPTETCLAASSLLFGGVLERFPKLKFCFAHGGGSFPYTLGRLEHGFNVRPDLCQTACQLSPSLLAKQFYFDSLVHDEAALTYLANKFGEDKVILGSDYPFPLGEHVAGELVKGMKSFTEDTKQAILANNCLNFLNLEKQQFIPNYSV